MGWRRRQRRGMENVWYFAAACVFIFLFGNLAMLQTYHGFVETSTSSRRPQYRGQGGKRAHLDFGDSGNGGMNSIQQLSRELLANKNLLQHARGSEYFVMESRLRKLMEITPDSAYSVNATSALISRYLDFSTSGPAMLDCRTIDNIKDREYVASGWTKAVFSGVHAGRKVALKTVDIGGQDVMACMDGGGSLQQCYHRAAQKIVKEIVLLQALAHDNVIQVLGFCVPDKPYDGDGDTTVVMVTELGEPIDLIKLLQMSWEDRLRISYDLTRLLDFLSRSARGALAMNDFRRQQFVLVHGALKLSDVDDAGFDEPSCRSDNECDLHFSSSNFTKRLACVEGRCQGYNEYRNMFNAGRHFTTFLLPHGAPPALRPLISDVVGTFENCSLTTRELVTWMDKVVHLYKTGRYLNRTAAKDFETSYKGTERSDLPGQFDYRCRMSLSGTGCTLSVFDLREAEDMCNGDHECRGFIVTNQRTWIGRTIVHFKNGTAAPSWNAHTKLYVKPS
ncbi:hypothetical protein C0Q70_13249 [Pomacea canaliculata]|uniref:Protein kinase domain-containing protein n=1 Tax=Pomacea canaliculata TaxID=400727 RepID=A0A2T7NWP0_POMCA|nr:extracellular tyrosine-protein kinase PKDCC-like [Pomacea canaliculata]XP_025105117.1 extracellular tyrosine-protein kinase PKDCC-like [Pomacea canaliculata]XP_025105118.1 extracellular tyrosine-protein kinase PKDCC-like [Pomacea canaliculata]XP_025105120.1 extracellular tyrosine-protein kinase PKDCC-like [Pomacea canaliculata]XP_025105121.1 extracellular tyrosine-protein kinase PKDCC-like [Pomacea canaliculata]PVD25591.1 hypothetical protein C0Q70_13249 [Pomacea canaliculata]